MGAADSGQTPLKRPTKYGVTLGLDGNIQPRYDQSTLQRTCPGLLHCDLNK